MTTSLEIHFPWGRYHATPWGRSANEAVVEWPPSPWRLLRALYATWKTRAPHLEEQVVQRLLSELAIPPAFALPAFIEAHTRHYMPDEAYGTDLALDAFVVFERGAAVVVSWPVDLKPISRDALSELAAQLPYLGRAESICEARILSGPPATEGSTYDPLSNEAAGDPSRRSPPVRVLVPQLPLDLAALTSHTQQVRGAGHIEPPGTRWQPYVRPIPAARTYARRSIRPKRPTAVRWAISSPALSSRRAAVAMTDVLRRACLHWYGRRFGDRASEVLAGKDPDGTPLEGHLHAHYLALDEDGDALLDHLVLWAPAGLGQEELQAVAALDRLTGFSHVADFRPTRLGLEALGDVRTVAPGLVGPARAWQTFTPFAPARHGKRGVPWSTHVEAQIRDELEWRGFPEPQSVAVLRGDWLSYRRHRVVERLEDARRAGGVRIAFREPVEGPIALGALSHFGLGLFVPMH